MVEAIGTVRINKDGNPESNVPSSAQQMVNQGELFSGESCNKSLERTGNSRTTQTVICKVNGEDVEVSFKIGRASRNWGK